MTSLMTQPVDIFAPPTPEPLTGQLLDTIEVTEGGVEWVEPHYLYNSINCMGIPSVEGICPTPTPTFSATQSHVDGYKFAVTLGFSCQALGTDWQQFQSNFDAVLDQRESAAVEQALMAIRFTGSLGGNNTAATDITGASAVLPRLGVALLEGDAAKKYVGLPLIHMPRTIASLLSEYDGLKPDGKGFRTALGSKIVAGAGYEVNVGPTGAAPAAGEMWMYSSGVVRARRSERIQQQPILDRNTNLMYVLAQRIYVVDVDCYLSAVRVSVNV